MIDNQDIRVEIVQDIEGLKDLKEIWEDLLENCPDKNPFLTFSWNTIWWEVYGKGKLLFVIIIYSGTKAIGIFPLMISQKINGLFIVRKMEFIGAGRSDYMGPVIAGNPQLCWFHAIDKIIEHRQLWDVVEFGRFIEESETFQKLIEVIANKKSCKNIVKCISTRGNPSIRIKGNWDEYYKHRTSAIRRSKVRRCIRLLEKEGEVSFSEFKEKENLDSLINELALVESNSWKGNKGKGILSTQRDRKFISMISDAFAELDMLSIHILRIDEKLIAFTFSFKYNNRYYGYSTSFVSKYKKYSPGFLLVKQTIEESFQDSTTEYDLLQGEEEYKLFWGNCFRKIFKVNLFHQGGFSFILFFQEKHLRPLAKAAKKKINTIVEKIGHEITDKETIKKVKAKELLVKQ